MTRDEIYISHTTKKKRRNRDKEIYYYREQVTDGSKGVPMIAISNDSSCSRI